MTSLLALLRKTRLSWRPSLLIYQRWWKALLTFPRFLSWPIDFHVSVACDVDVTIALKKAKRKGEKPKCENSKSHIVCSLLNEIKKDNQPIRRLNLFVELKLNCMRNTCKIIKLKNLQSRKKMERRTRHSIKKKNNTNQFSNKDLLP